MRWIAQMTFKIPPIVIAVVIKIPPIVIAVVRNKNWIFVMLPGL
jgi:hypothetical protein